MEQNAAYIFCEALSHYGSGAIALLASILLTARNYERDNLDLNARNIAVSSAEVISVVFAAEMFSIAIFDYFTGQFPS